MYDVISVGTTTVDFYFKGHALREKDSHFYLAIGAKYFADFFHEQIGGGATNVAIGCAKLGLRVALVSEIGNNEFKRVIFEKLDMHGVSHKYCPIVDDYRNFSCIFAASNGEKTVVNYRTKNRTLLRPSLPEEIYRHARVMYMGNLADATEHSRVRLLNEAKRHSLTTVTTLGGSDCRSENTQTDGILRASDILIINTHEFADLVRVPYHEINFKQNVLQTFAHLYFPQIVVLTDGERGSYGYTRSTQVVYQPAITPRKIVDTTGAGDGYVAGFVASYVRVKDIAKAMEAGAAYASQKLEHLGAN
jgi:sugar/nucleoside kinase (ribokinase family)